VPTTTWRHRTPFSWCDVDPDTQSGGPGRGDGACSRTAPWADAQGGRVRRILVNAHIDDWRHRSRRPEAPLAEHHDYARATGSATEDRDALLRALAGLPEGQRKVIVLRFFLDLSVQDTASDLGVTTGTVKSQSVRGLARLRELLGDELVPSPPDIKEDAR